VGSVHGWLSLDGVNMAGKIYHLVVRYTEDMYEVDDVIVRHNQIALRQDAVWVGKPFHKMGQATMDIINQQIAEGLEPRLYFIDTKMKRPIAHFGKLLAVTMKAPSDRELIPMFYQQKKILSRMKVWMKVDFLDGFYLNDLPALEKMNEVYNDAEMLADKSSGYFILYEDRE
jgi:hypothetical protein